MSRGLVGDDVRHDAARHNLGIDICSVAAQSDRDWPAFGPCRIDQIECCLERSRFGLEIAGLDALGDAGRINLDAEDRGLANAWPMPFAPPEITAILS
jgi:hypothetical protein